jgi:hypothetical protein
MERRKRLERYGVVVAGRDDPGFADLASFAAAQMADTIRQEQRSPRHAFVPDREGLTAGGVRVCDTCGGVESATLHAAPSCPHEGYEWQSVRPGTQCPFCGVKPGAARDACQFCLGAKGGGPGNENVYGEGPNRVVVCDHCTPLVLQVLAGETTEMRVCEIARLVLRPGQLYRFSVDENCAECRAYGGGAGMAAYALQAQPVIDHELECHIPVERRGPRAHLLVCERTGCPGPLTPHPRRLL